MISHLSCITISISFVFGVCRFFLNRNEEINNVYNESKNTILDLNIDNENLKKKIQNLTEKNEKLRWHITDFAHNKKLKELEAKKKHLHDLDLEIDTKRSNFHILLNEKSKGFPTLAKAFAEFHFNHEMDFAKYLESKSHPAKKTAEAHRDIAKTNKNLLYANKILQYKLKVLADMYPFIEDLLEPENEEYIDKILDIRLGIQKNEEIISEAEDVSINDEDEILNLISKEEFGSFGYIEKHQLALERYISSRKTSWQIGRDYEQFVGYEREMQGAKVIYQGMQKGYDDLGRDLIIYRSALDVEIVQCKNWKSHRQIHEKHVFQLYGTMTAFKLDNPSIDSVVGALVTTSTLTERAKRFANNLGIKFFENYQMKEFPRIKCHHSSLNGEKIFHLPFDQQYDSTIIEFSKNEFYSWSVKDAVEKGYRRAYRWSGNESQTSI